MFVGQSARANKYVSGFALSLSTNFLKKGVHVNELTGKTNTFSTNFAIFPDPYALWRAEGGLHVRPGTFPSVLGDCAHSSGSVRVGTWINVYDSAVVIHSPLFEGY